MFSLLSLGSLAQATETVTVTGGRIYEGSAPTMGGGVASPGQQLEKQEPIRGEGVGGGRGFGPSNAQLAELAINQIGALVTTLRDAQAWATLDVTVTTATGLKVEVHLELGYGKVDVKSRKILKP